MRALEPTVSSANSTGRPSSCASRSATGPRLYCGSGAPLGRPRCAATMTRAPWSSSLVSTGRDARTRPSSVTFPSLIGTLRSDRTRTRRPWTPCLISSSRVRMLVERVPDERGQVDQPVRVAPLVVVPADDLDLVADHLRQARVEDARRRVGDDVGADDRVLGVGQDALERAVGGGLVGGLDLVDAGLLRRGDGQVGGRAGRDGHAQRVAVELALQLRQHEPDRLGGTGAGRHDVQRRGTRPAQVLVRAVLQVLVLRVRVDRRHQATLDAELVVEHLGQRAEAVRGARRVRDDRVLRGVVARVVDAHHDRDVLVAGRRRDDDLLRAGVDVLVRVGGLGEEPGRFDDDVDAEVAPRQVRRVALGEDLDVLAADRDAVVGGADLGREPAQDAVVLQQVRHGLLVAEVVRGDEFDVGTRCGEGAEVVAADPAEAVDAHTYGHCICSSHWNLDSGATLSNRTARL